MSRVSQLFAAYSILAVTTGALAGDPTSWIPMSNAVQIAQQAVSGTSPIKAELYVTTTGAFYEVKEFQGNTLYEVKVNAANGQVMNIDDSDGGGAQDKIAEAQFVMSQSSFTLTQAMTHAQSLFPDYFITMIEMEDRDGTAIFDVRLIRGPYRLEVRLAASSGAILRQRLHLLPGTSGLYNIFVPDDIQVIDIEGVITASQMIAAAEQQYAARAFEIELKTPTPTTYRYQMRLFKNNTVIKATYNGATGALISSNIVTDPEYIAKVQSSINQAPLTLRQAITAAQTVVPGGFAVEAKLRLQNVGRLYAVEFVTVAGILEVKVDAVSGAIRSISFDD